MDVFTRDQGTYQCRISPDGNGYVYELGHQLLSLANVTPGDNHSIEQRVSFEPGSRLLLADVHIVTPKILPAGAAWEFSVWLDNAVMFRRRLRPAKRPIALHDLRISLRDADPNDEHTVGFMLELVI